MHRMQYPMVFSDGISKAHKGGMKYATLVGAALTTAPECGIVWRVRMTRLPSSLFYVFSSFVLVQCAARAPH